MLLINISYPNPQDVFRLLAMRYCVHPIFLIAPRDDTPALSRRNRAGLAAGLLVESWNRLKRLPLKINTAIRQNRSGESTGKLSTDGKNRVTKSTTNKKHGQKENGPEYPASR